MRFGSFKVSGAPPCPSIFFNLKWKKNNGLRRALRKGLYSMIENLPYLFLVRIKYHETNNFVLILINCHCLSIYVYIQNSKLDFPFI